MGLRDWDYIEARLLAPGENVSEAIGRLRQLGLTEEANEILEAQKAFIDICRKVRASARSKVVRSQQSR